MLSDEEKKELLLLANSFSLKKDMKKIAENRHNPFIKDAAVDIDAYITFLSEYNAFINHEPKPFKQILCREMKI